MRDIKFRAWTRKGMVTPAVWVNDESLPCYSLSSAPLKPLMQYTGLTDKNGVEIYEGDLIHISRYDGDLQHAGEVYFNSGKYMIKNGWKAGCDDLGGYGAECIEIVGNIYEHGHLLDSN